MTVGMMEDIDFTKLLIDDIPPLTSFPMPLKEGSDNPLDTGDAMPGPAKLIGLKNSAIATPYAASLHESNEKVTERFIAPPSSP